MDSVHTRPRAGSSPSQGYWLDDLINEPPAGYTAADESFPTHTTTRTDQ